jgi:hypothetical protein
VKVIFKGLKSMSFSEAVKEPKAPIYSTIAQFPTKHPAFTKGGLRHQIFNADKNGLSASGAIVRMGRKILIDETKFFAWIEAGAK